jgi:hypothetical protein
MLPLSEAASYSSGLFGGLGPPIARSLANKPEVGFLSWEGGGKGIRGCEVMS